MSVPSPDRPLVTLCVPTRNRAGLLRHALSTLLAQDYEPLEILISDNCSSDDTERVGLEVAKRDRRVRYVRHQSDIGLYGNHNFCLNESRGDFVCLWHDDDEHDPGLITRYVAFMTLHPDVGVVSSDCTLIDDEGRVIGSRDRTVADVSPGIDFIGRTFRSGQSAVLCPGAMIRRSALRDARFAEDGPLGFADFVLWFSIAERWQIGHIPERLWSYRLHRESLSRRKVWHIVNDYQYHLGRYCESHLGRWPEHGRLVARWRSSLNRFLFWALAYEIALHAAPPRRPDASGRYRTVFDIADYTLSQKEVETVMELMQHYRHGLAQRALFLAISTLVRHDFTHPLGWAAGHVALWRRLTGLR